MNHDNDVGGASRDLELELGHQDDCIHMALGDGSHEVMQRAFPIFLFQE